MPRNKISLHSIHVLRAHQGFDPAVLKGRHILPFNYRPGGEYMSPGMEVVLHDNPRPGITAKITGIGGAFILAGEDRMYVDPVEIQAWDAQKNLVPFAGKGDGAKLVTTPDGKAVGFVIAGGDGNGGHKTYLAPAEAIFNPPPEHIRECLKGAFDPAVLQGRAVDELKDRRSSLWVHLEGTPQTIAQTSHTYEVTIGSATFTNALYVHSFVECPDDSDGRLQSLFADRAFFSTPADRGKLVLACDQNTPGTAADGLVVAVVAGQETTYHQPHGRWYQRTFLAPAHDFLIP